MTVLHGSWVPSQNQFWVWGEVWRRIDPSEFLSVDQPQVNLYSMTPEELVTCIQTYNERASRSQDADSGKKVLILPKTVMQDTTKQASKVAAGRRKLASRAEAADTTKTLPKLTSPPWGTFEVALPSLVAQDSVRPIHSASVGDGDSAAQALFPWQVAGFWLPPSDAIAFLNSLPLGLAAEDGSIFGADLRYWSHVCRWGLDLLARSKYIPALSNATPSGSPPEQPNRTVDPRWQVLIDSAVDQARLRRFSNRMPLACRTYPQARVEADHPLYLDVPAPPQILLFDVLGLIIDNHVQMMASTQPFPASTPLSRDLPLREWLQALSTRDADLSTDTPGWSRLQEAILNWQAPLQNLQANQTALFRTCFTLHPPPADERDWLLVYSLQAIDDPTFHVDATSIWNHPVDLLYRDGRVVEDPQETLLAGLGRAARLWEPIKANLKQQQPIHQVLDPIQAFEFIKSIAWRLQDIGFGIVLPGGLADQDGSQSSRLGLMIQAEAPARTQRQRLGLKSLLNFQWQLSMAGEPISRAEFNRLLAQQSPLVEINGKWVELRPQDVKAAQEFFNHRKDETKLSVEDALRISTGDTQVIERLPVVKFEATGALATLIDTLTKGNQTLEPIAEPEGFRGQLRPYQARGVAWLAFLEQWGLGACLADDMGLGKTIQLIAFMLYLRQQGWLGSPTLLVCPTSVMGNWEREVKRFAPELKVLVQHGDKRSHGATFAKAAQKVQLVITSYALVYRDIADLKEVEWQGVVLDEAQNIKNPDAKQSKAVHEIDAQFRIALTGTPVENRLSELWSIMDFLNPAYLGPRNFFQRRFATPIERYGDTASLQTLRSLVQPFILRRLKTDRSIIQDLPEKQEMTVFCSLSSEQASLYQATVDEALAAIDAADGVQRRGMILALLTKLKQICNHPAHFLQDNKLGLRKRSGKLQRLDEMLEELILEGDRALIFTQFAEWGKLLKAHLDRALGQETLFLHGGTSKKQREDMVDRFQHDPNGPKLFILSLKAGGVGLNLTRANHVFHYDRWWNPAVENQATDRVFRIGQTRNVQVHKFVCTGTLEERIHELIESKKALSEQVVGAGEQWLTELDTDQLRKLLLLDRDAVFDDA